MLTLSKKRAACMMSTSCLHLSLAKLHCPQTNITDFLGDFSVAIDRTTNGIVSGYYYLGLEYSDQFG
jgi:hypothetical protein